MDGSYHIDTALRGFVDRIVKLDEDKEAILGDRREVFAEAKEAGFNVTTVRQMVREFRMEPEARNAMYQQQNEYRAGLGMLGGTPLGDYAEEQEARTVAMPAKPFAEQPVHTPRPRGRRKADADSKPMFDA